MGSKKNDNSTKPKRRPVRKTIELKKEVIAKFESGTRVSDLAIEYGMAKSTVSSILKNKDVIKEANVAKGVTVLAVNRSPIIEEVEKLLLVWINENKLTGDTISKTIICEKAKQLHDDLKRNTPGTSAQGDDFKASRGWFHRFKRRSGIQSGTTRREAASASKDAAVKFIEEFKNFMQSEGFAPQQVFKCYETGLFWKKLPKRTYITEDERLPGAKPMKDKLTILLCANASGDLKIKPLLVYHTENPRVFKKNNVIKSRLSVMWRANSKACITRQFFTEWMYEVFAQTVLNYLEQKNLPLKALLLIDDTPAHPPGLEDDLMGEYSFIQVKFLPGNTTPLIQSMDQHVISNFKKLYTKALFQRCFEMTSATELTLRDFWRNHFNILHCLRIIDKAWEEVSFKTLNSAWRYLWQDCVSFEGFDADSAVVDDIVSLGKFMGLDMDCDDVEELVKDELTTEELQELHREQQQQEDVNDENSSEDEESSRGSISIGEIEELCYHWEKTQEIVAKWHPNIAVVNKSINLFNDNVIAHFRKILINRQRDVILDVFLKEEFEGSDARLMTAIKTEPDVT